MWQREARADIAEKEANDLFRRFVAMADDEMHEFAAGFDLARTQLELNYGEIAQWSPKTKADLSKKLLQVAKESVEETPNGAYGVALLGIMIEAQTLRGEKAARLATLIEGWRQLPAIEEIFKT
jgi:hypothetical protein